MTSALQPCVHSGAVGLVAVTFTCQVRSMCRPTQSSRRSRWQRRQTVGTLEWKMPKGYRRTRAMVRARKWLKSKRRCAQHTIRDGGTTVHASVHCSAVRCRQHSWQRPHTKSQSSPKQKKMRRPSQKDGRYVGHAQTCRCCNHGQFLSRLV